MTKDNDQKYQIVKKQPSSINLILFYDLIEVQIYIDVEMNKQKKIDKLGKETKDLFTTPLFDEDQAGKEIEAIKEQDLILDIIQHMNDNAEEYKAVLTKQK